MRILLHLCPENTTQTHTRSFSSHAGKILTLPIDRCTHLDKVHIYSVELQPLAFVEERNLCLRRTLSPGDGKRETSFWVYALEKGKKKNVTSSITSLPGSFLQKDKLRTRAHHDHYYRLVTALRDKLCVTFRLRPWLKRGWARMTAGPRGFVLVWLSRLSEEKHMCT